MFTLEQIKAAHAKVKSGADFPAYAKELTLLGLTHYITEVVDGSSLYFGPGQDVSGQPVYAPIAINPKADKAALQKALTAHQQGQTDYLTFCKQAAAAGVEKWVTYLLEKEVRYIDTKEELILSELFS